MREGSTVSRSLRYSAIAFLAGATCILPMASSSAAPDKPTLAMRAVLHSVEVGRFDGDSDLFVSAGVYVVARQGAFEIDSVQHDGTQEFWQVNRSAGGVDRLRKVQPDGAVSLQDGLPRFFHIVLANLHGKTLAESWQPFCPGNYGLARVDASGPDNPTYPYSCGSQFSENVVWGLDRGWGVGLSLDVPNPKIPDGHYALTIAMNKTYVDTLGVPATDSRAKIAIDLTTSSGGCGKDGPCPPPIIDAQPGAVPAIGAHPGTEGPHPSAGEAALPHTKPTDGAGGVPDLRALPAHDLSTHAEGGHDYLDFGATIWNAGSGPLVLEGFRPGDAETMPATQFIYQDGKPVRSQVVSSFEFDHRPGHDHWHMEDVAQYDLLNSAGARIVLSGKQSFCLAPTDAVDLTLPGADWRPDTAGLWSACSGEDAIWIREVLSAGWGDTYFQSKAGQSFDITHVPNGHYKIRITTDPNNNLIETDYTNNAAIVDVTITGTKSHRRVRLG